MNIVAISGSLRQHSSNAALLRAAPEYAHGVPGSLKNLLDWLVSAGALVDKPVAVWNAAPAGGQYAQASLLETLRTMNWRVVEEASLIEPFLTRRMTGELEDAAALQRVATAIAALS